MLWYFGGLGGTQGSSTEQLWTLHRYGASFCVHVFALHIILHTPFIHNLCDLGHGCATGGSDGVIDVET